MPPVDDTIVDEALEEIIVALGSFEPLLEGLRDYSRLNINPDTMTVITDAIAEHERRMARLTAARDSLQALLSDGYPQLPPHKVSDSVLADIKSQRTSIDAASEHFVSDDTATTLALQAGAVEPKR